MSLTAEDDNANIFSYVVLAVTVVWCGAFLYPHVLFGNKLIKELVLRTSFIGTSIEIASPFCIN